MTRSFRWMLVLFAVTVVPLAGFASDWAHWRGPKQNGVGDDKNLPAKFDGNVLWRAPYGCRSTPLVLNGYVYVINYDSDKDKAGDDIHETIQERVMCLDAKTGKKVWEHLFPVFHTDIVTSRLGWTNLAADSATGNIYAHGTQGFFMCLDGKKGKVIWQHSMGEEFGRVSGYGGRITSPIVDGNLAILGMVNTSWGDQAKGGNRFVALDKDTGEVVWWSTPAASKGTYYSAPVVATIGKQRLLISGGADGSVFAIQVSTGVPVWHHIFSRSPINSSPVVDGNFVYIGQGEENANPPNAVQGRVICVDASQIVKGAPKVVWQVDGIKARYASPILHEGRLYMPDDTGKLFCLDAKTGDQIWKYNYGRNSRGSPVFADGKIYVGEVDSRFHILEPGKAKCKKLDVEFFPAVNGVANVEVNGSPAIANGCVYFSTTDEVICLGTKEGVAAKLLPPDKVNIVVNAKIAHLQIVPAEVAVHPGATVQFKARAFDADGNFIKEVTPEWTLPAPAPPKGVKFSPPALKGGISSGGKLTVDAKLKAQQSIVVGTFQGVSGRARVRVAPQLPYFNDFNGFADGIVPGGWVNTQGKWHIKTLEKGNKVLAKVNDKASPLITTDNGYITLPTARDYTIQCDVFGTKVGNDLPDMGIVANRYTLSLAGNIQKLRIQSWDPVPRIDKTIQYNWNPDVWYRMKLTVEVADGKGLIRGKCWPRDEKEPATWNLTLTDSRPIAEGSAALYGNVVGVQQDRPGTEIYYDNLRIVPNKAAPKAGGANTAESLPVEVGPRHVFLGRPLFPLFARLRR